MHGWTERCGSWNNYLDVFILTQDIDTFLLLGTSIDNSPGEVFDKAARRLNLHNRPEFINTSGGYAIQSVGKNGDPQRFRFTEPLLKQRTCMFSFSSLRTHFHRKIEELESQDLLDEATISDFCASVEYTIGQCDNSCEISQCGG